MELCSELSHEIIANNCLQHGSSCGCTCLGVCEDVVGVVRNMMSAYRHHRLEFVPLLVAHGYIEIVSMVIGTLFCRLQLKPGLLL